ncbi:MAG: DUF4292 domain-containing protein [Flavobacteriaceae bacterium]
MIKRLPFILLIFLTLSSCKSKKTRADKAQTKLLTMVLKNHEDQSFQKKTLNASLKVKYKGKTSLPSVKGALRILKDEVIWLSISKFISVGRLKITPNRVQFYNKLDQTYYDGDFTLLSNFLGTDVDFKQVQNILVGEAVFDLNKKDYAIVAEDHNFVFSPKNQHKLYDLFFWLDANSYKINKQEIRNDNKLLSVQYSDFEVIDNANFPKQIYVLAKDVKNTNTINIDYKSIEFDRELRFPFKIPSGYKEIKL